MGLKSNAANYYWIGGSGNWTDLTHWATTSGGTITHNQIPTAADDVFFNANSFTATGQVVTLNPLTALMQNMSWAGVTNNPTLAGPANNLIKIYGSLTLSNAMQVTFLGMVSFDANDLGNTVAMGGKNFTGTVAFNGVGASWILQDEFTTLGSINLNSGTLNTNNQIVNARSFNSGGTLIRALSMGSSQFNLSGNGTSWSVANTGLTLNSGTSLINMSGTVIPFFFGGNFTYYDVNFTSTNATTTGYIFDNSLFRNVRFYSEGRVSSNTFNLLRFDRSGYFDAGATCQNLIFTPGFSYTLSSSSPLTVNGLITANGNCGAYIDISSNTEGTQATLSHPAGAVPFSYVILKDIRAIGGGTFTANNSIDLGNNTGITINTTPVSNLYWIGNSGDWTDGSHWSLTSGGAASGCAPSPFTNVFFDANSFSLPAQSVNVNSPTAYCRNMSWVGATGTPALASVTGIELKIFGSLELITAMTVGYTGATYFQGVNTGNTIRSAGKAFNGNVVFNGLGGSYGLLDNITISQELNITAGTVNTNSNNVTAGRFRCQGNRIRGLIMGASVFNIQSGSSCWEVDATVFTLNAGTSIINLNSNSSPRFNGGSLQYYDLNFTSILASTNSTIASGNIFHDVLARSNIQINTANTFGNLSLEQNGNFLANNNIVNLNLAAGFVYTLTAGTNQVLTGNINAIGTCGALINIQSSISGSVATITKATGVINTSYLVLKDIAAAGGATFTAASSVNLGNNSGWNFTALSGTNLYWIGDSGNWSDGNHWSFTSGGSASGCSPSPLDNVFFDANSFSSPAQIVTLDVPIAYCRDMTWTGATGTPSFNGAATIRLKVFGSMLLIAAMNLNYDGFTDFQASTTGHFIRSNTKLFKNSIFFVGTGGGWTLQDSLRTSRSIFLNIGALNTNNQKVVANDFNSSSGLVRSLNMGSSLFFMTGNTSIWNAAAAGFTLNAGTSLILGNNPFIPSFNGGNLIYYDLHFTTINYTFNVDTYGNNTFHNVTFDYQGTLNGNNTINELRFLADGTIRGSNTIATLILTAGFTYNLSASGTQTITNRLQAQGSCTSYLLLNSTSPGVQANISKNVGSILGYNIHMRDIRGIGGASFFAYNSLNLGNNTGWNFAVLPTLLPPSTVTGPASVCAGASNVVYTTTPVSGAIYYEWTVPAGATIVSGQGDTIVVVNFGTATTGAVSVLTYNGCNYSSTGSSITVVLAPSLPPTVSISSNPTGPVCTGASILFTASTTNTVPGTVTYTFRVNGTPVQVGALSTYNYTTPINGAVVTCDILTSVSGACSAVNTATSNSVSVQVNSASFTPTVTLTSDATGSLCAGTSVNFSAIANNVGGGTIQYDFMVNGSSVQLSAASSFSSNTLLNGSIVTCNISIAGGACLTASSASSNVITMVVNPIITPSINITATSNTICASTTVTFTANPTDAGTSPTYQWRVNGVNVGTNSNTFTTSTLINADVVSCNILGSATCSSIIPVASNSITMQVTAVTVATIAITSSTNNVCAGTSISFTAAIANGGASPAFQWKVNGINVGTNTNSFTTTTLQNSDVVSCTLTSSQNCVIATSVNSNAITMAILPNDVASIVVSNNLNNICPGTAVTFTATATNAGTSPIYQWQINGNNIGTNSATFTSNTLINNDAITCTLQSNAPCLAANTVASLPITIMVRPIPSPTISIASSNNNICPGTTVTFTATTVDAGVSPVYMWRVNGIVVGTNSNSYTSSTLQNADVVTCSLTSSIACAVPGAVQSNGITMQVINVPITSLNITSLNNATCEGTRISFTATGINAGFNPSYQWKVNALRVGTNAANFSSTTLRNNDIVTCEITLNDGCNAGNVIVSNPITAVIYPNPIVSINPATASILFGRTIQLSASSSVSGSAFLWTSNSTLSDITIANPVANPSVDVVYNVSATTPNGCKGSASASIKVLKGYNIPNSFTPNGDRINDVFRIPPATAIEKLQYFIVYDRYGQKIFETNNITRGWDGRMNGQPASAGAYVYVIKASGINGELILKGSIMLLR